MTHLTYTADQLVEQPALPAAFDKSLFTEKCQATFAHISAKYVA